MGEVLWQPSAARRDATQIMALAKKHGFTGAGAIEDLRRWSIGHAPAFWTEMFGLGEVIFEGKLEPATLNGDAMLGARWFPGVRLNFAENLLKRDDDAPALVFVGENGRRAELSWAELQTKVRGLAAAMKAEGVEPGDRVAACMPDSIETVVAMLAATALGAVWSSTSPDFGKDGVLDRFGQIEPKLLVAVDGYVYNGKRLSIVDKVAAVAGALPSLKRTIVCPFLDDDPDLSAVPNAVLFDDFLVQDPPPLAFARLPFDAPLYVLYSSGTTGKPKAIVHGIGGTLLQHLKEHRLHTDLKAGDRLFYFTTCGWMMWNWMVSALAGGTTLVLFDGSPFYPKPEALWDLVRDEKVTVFGTSAKYIDACKKAGLRPKDTHDLTPLRALLSTGSPLVAESFDYVYDAIKDDLQLASVSGGTDIVSCFVLGNPAGAVRRGQIQMRGLGLDVEVWNDEGQAVVGEKGELVCTRPFPAMPIMFWNDEGGERYRSSYFDRFEGVWCHGDYAEITEDGGVIIHGRSDAVLNPGGVRIGTAEIYRQVEQVEEVLESVCVGQDWGGDVRVVLFVKLKEGAVLDDGLKDKIKRQVRANATPRHVPARIVAVADIPRTLSGKITEIAVRDTIHGRPVKNTEALANPDALDLYRDLEDLRA